MSGDLIVQRVAGAGTDTFKDLPRGVAAAWIVFDMVNVTVGDSENFSGIVDNGPGSFGLSFISAMATANYSAQCTSTVSSSTTPDQTRPISKQTTGFGYYHADDEPVSAKDVSDNQATVMGDLA